MKFPDPGLDAFLFGEPDFGFEVGGIAYRVDPEPRTGSRTCLSFRSPAGVLVSLDLNAHSCSPGER